MRLSRATPGVYGAVLLVNVLLLSVSSFQQSEAKGQQHGTTTRILEQTVHVTAGTETVGQLEGTTTSIDCSKLEGRPAFSVRQATLLLQNVALSNCQHQAVVLVGPGAVLQAWNVTFSGHGSSSSSVQGLVISAQQASILLQDVLITDNKGAVTRGFPSYQPPCSNNGITSAGGNQAAPCGRPVISSSLIHLNHSSLTTVNTRINSNTAGAIISAVGSKQHSLQLLSQTQLQGNHAEWLILADSFYADPVGQRNLLAPHPSEQMAKAQQADFKLPYTTHDFMGAVKSMNMSSGWQQQLRGFVQNPPVEHYVGQPPKDQKPLLVRLEEASVALNTVTGGLMWLRLVNTSMQRVSITSNAATVAAQPSTPRSSAATAAATERGGMEQDLATDLLTAAREGLERKNILEPALCDMGVQQRALLQVVGPAAFDIYRSNISNNLHPSGAILRVSDGLSLSSIRSSSLSSNIATAVLRLEGHGWVHDARAFMSATQAIDSDLYKQVEDTSKEAFDVYFYKKFQDQNVVKDNTSTDTTSFVVDSVISDNAVFHAVMLVKGERMDWKKYESAKASAVLNNTGRMEAAEPITMDTFSAVSWWTNNTFSRNTFIEPRQPSDANWGLVKSSTYLNALSVVLSSTRKLREQWGANNNACTAAVVEGAVEKSRKDYNVKPAVIASTFAQNFFNGRLESNVGFAHLVSLHSTATVASLDVRNNAATSSLCRFVDCDVFVYDTHLHGNQLHGGSVLEGNTLKAHLAKVTVANNRVQTTTTPAPTSPLVDLGRIHLGSLRNITIQDNTGPGWSFAIRMTEFSLLSDTEDVLIQNNTASGVRMVSTVPWYNNQTVGLTRVRVINNRFTAEGGGFLIGGFSSRVGRDMLIKVDHCIFANNTPTGHRAPLQGGGIALEAPPEDRPDGGGARGFLQNLEVVISNTLLEGNRAVEGGGLWSAWPMRVNNCTIRNNIAEASGGGLFLMGLKSDELGQGGTSITSSTVVNNVAAFGGGVACDRCRAVLYDTTISGNIATSEQVPSRNSTRRATDECSGAELAAAGSNGSNGTCVASTPQPATSRLLQDTVPGAGAAVAAILGEKSYLRICGRSTTMPARMTGNKATRVGGLVYLSDQGPNCSRSCSVSSASGCHVDQMPTRGGGSWCGVELHNVDWSGTNASEVGRVLAWTPGRPSPAFSMHCHQAELLGTGDHNNITKGSCGCGQGFELAHKDPIESLTEMQRLVSHELPYQLYVYNATCLQQQLQQDGSLLEDAWEACCMANSDQKLPGKTVTRIPRAFAGDTVNLTVSLRKQPHAGPLSGRWSAPCSNGSAEPSVPDNNEPKPNAAQAPALQALLQQDDTGQLFVIGSSRENFIRDNGFLATFCNMALQPVRPPTFNRKYSFKIKANMSSGLLRQVPAVTVTVELLRCTLGQYMTVNRCVRCAESGTFSLSHSKPCQPCVPGGLCTQGVLLPREGFYSHNPLVPQIIPCPLRGACTDAGAKMSLQQLQSLPPWSASLSNASVSLQQLRAVSSHRALLQQGGRGVNSSSGSSSSSTQQRGDLNRTEALLQYSSWLAQLIANDTVEREHLLADVRYQDLLSSWHKVQCTKGYKGLMCGTCDAAYQEPSDSTSTAAPHVTRFAFHRNQCVDCTHASAVTWLLLVLLFLVFFAYVGIGIVCQINSVDEGLLQGNLPASDAPHKAACIPFWWKYHSRNQQQQQQQQQEEQQATGQNSTSEAGPPLAPKVTDNRGSDAVMVCIDIQQERDQFDHAASERGPAVHYMGADTTEKPADAAAAAAGDVGNSSCCSSSLAAVHGAGHNSPQGTAAATGAGPGCNVQQQSQASRGAAGAANTKPDSARTHMHTLIAMWKVLTSYLQVLAMVRFLPVIWQADSMHPLAYADLSSFSQFAAFDCILPGPPKDLAYTRILGTALVPVFLFLAFLAAWSIAWALQRAGAKLHRYLESNSETAATSGSFPSAVSINTASTSTAVRSEPTSASWSALNLRSWLEDRGSAPDLRSPASTCPSESMTSRFSSTSSWLAATAVQLAQQVPVSVLQKVGAMQQPVSLRRYLSMRLIITLVVLGYSCYSLFTSSMLQTLACQPITQVAALRESSLGRADAGYGFGSLLLEYGTLHYDWLSRRFSILSGQRSGDGWRAAEDPSKCHPGSAAASAGVCQVTGYFWKQDYSVQCFAGGHAALASVGAVLLVLVGMVLPVLLGWFFWHNRSRLWEPGFSAKYSFLYHEYRAQVCYWEFIIMARKLAFLGVFVALTPQLASPDLVPLLQLLVATAIGVAAVLLNVFLQPFEDQRLNNLECAALTATTLTFCLLGACVTVSTSEAGRRALLIIAGTMNFGLICVFFWHIGALIWREFGRHTVKAWTQRLGWRRENVRNRRQGRRHARKRHVRVRPRRPRDAQ